MPRRPVATLFSFLQSDLACYSLSLSLPIYFSVRLFFLSRSSSGALFPLVLLVARCSGPFSSDDFYFHPRDPHSLTMKIARLFAIDHYPNWSPSRTHSRECTGKATRSPFSLSLSLSMYLSIYLSLCSGPFLLTFLAVKVPSSCYFYCDKNHEKERENNAKKLQRH